MEASKQMTEASKQVKLKTEASVIPQRPERAEAPSPGHRPGYCIRQQCAL